MKNSGKKITAVILFIFLSFTAYSAEIKTELTGSRIEEGESTVLKVMISGTTSNIRPVKVPAIDGLSISLSGTSRSFQFINGKSWTGIILSFTIEGEKKGVYRMPPFIFEADGEQLRTGEFVITVTEGGSGKVTMPGVMRGEIELTAGEVYAGEPVLMRYYINTHGDDIRIEGMKEQPESKGFVIKALKEEGQAGSGGKIYIASYCLVAAESGKHELGGGTLSVIIETGDGFFSRGVRREVRFPRKTVNVKPIPSSGKPAFYNGDVGEFTIEAGEASGSFRAGEEVRIPVKVRGRGNLIMMSKLSVDNQDGLKLLVEESEPVLSVDDRTLTGEKGYTITIIPEREGEYKIGRIFLPYFNPYKGIYERAESSPVAFNISAAGNKDESADGIKSHETSSQLPKIVFIAAVIVIAACCVILYLQTGRYRIVKAEKTEGVREEPESEKPADRTDQILENFEKAYNAQDYKFFLQYAEKLAGLFNTEKLDELARIELAAVKDKINLFRYGGASPSDEDIRNIYTVIKKGF